MTTAQQVREQLAELEDERLRAVNARHGDDHAVNLTRLRALAKPFGHDLELARALWASGDSAARLVAILVARPRDFTAEEYDAMLREARTPKVHDWLVSYLVAKSPHAEQLRRAWFADPDPVVAAAGWWLTARRVAGRAEGLDLGALLDQVEAEMREAHPRLQWEMNSVLAHIGIEHPQLRDRALDIGERLRVLEDYPTPPGCISPFAPVWIREMVARREG